MFLKFWKNYNCLVKYYSSNNSTHKYIWHRDVVAGPRVGEGCGFEALTRLQLCYFGIIALATSGYVEVGYRSD